MKDKYVFVCFAYLLVLEKNVFFAAGKFFLLFAKFVLKKINRPLHCCNVRHGMGHWGM